MTPEEQRIAKAIKDIQAARAWHVPYDKLLRRSQGMLLIESNGGHNKSLSAEQETALLLYIDRCEEK